LTGGSVVATVLLALTVGCATVPVRRGTEDTFTATAYCDSGITKSGRRTREGTLAADLRLLPLGSVVRITAAGNDRYERLYTVLDTGASMRGRRVDIYVRDCDEARRFGVRRVRLRIVRLGSGG
jgi:3D (Asp-Asp-Asp) domain-containing protein